MTRRPAALATAATVAVSLAAPAVAAAPKNMSRSGVGQVKLGALHSALKAKGAVGAKLPGCELAGPDEEAAKLKAPLEGAVQLTRQDPRRVRSIIITKGARAKGVGFGDSREEIAERFPSARFDSSTEDVFGITLVTIPKRDGGRYQFGVDAKTNEVTVMGVPFIAFCE